MGDGPMSAISVWMKCEGCGYEDSILIHSPVELEALDITVERMAMRCGWKIRTPAGKPKVQICPTCAKEGRI